MAPFTVAVNVAFNCVALSAVLYVIAAGAVQLTVGVILVTVSVVVVFVTLIRFAPPL